MVGSPAIDLRKRKDILSGSERLQVPLRSLGSATSAGGNTPARKTGKSPLPHEEIQ